jgi:pilus assembly protein Flp/PilA
LLIGEMCRYKLYHRVKGMIQRIRGFNSRVVCCLTSEEGQALVEYALLLLLIAIVVIVMLQGIGLRTNEFYSRINNAMP